MMFGFRNADPQLSVFWDRFVYIGVVFMPSLMHHFSLIFTKRKGQRPLLMINYLLSFAFLAASRTAYFVDDLYLYSWGAHSQARFLHHGFLLYFFLGTGIFFYNIWTYYRKHTQRILRIQSIYVFLAFAIVIFIGGSAFLYAYGLDTRFPFAYITGIVFPVMLFYAVSKHHLLDARVVGAEVLVGIVNFILITEIFLSRGLEDLLVRLAFAIAVGVMSLYLIQSIRIDNKRKEEMTELAHSLEKANLRLQELDRQKTEFLSIASHQLRTPLSILKGYIELLMDGAYGKPTIKMKKTLKEMDDSNERLVHLVDDFLNITRIEQERTKFHYKKHNMVKILDSVYHELKNRAEKKGLELIWKGRKGALSAAIDEEKIRHVIFNFVDNAIKYSEKGTIVMEVKTEDQGVTVKVKDQGIGFDREDDVNFFQKFYRGKNVENSNVDGTGLGIYVCRKFVEAHAGKIWAKSDGLGKGSEFGFWVPKIARTQ